MMKLLSDRELQSFVVNGFIILKPSVSDPSIHDNIYSRLQQLYQDGADPGNAVFSKAQHLEHVLASPEVVGACTSLLGQAYLLHPHRRAHESKPGRCDQYVHQDSYKGRGLFRHHRPHWLMGMYYPQTTSLDMGPTEVLPGTQYYAGGDKSRFHAEVEAWSTNPLPMTTSEPGTFVLMHYDLWHRAMKNTSSKTRFMVKFVFARTVLPPLPQGMFGCAGSTPAAAPFAQQTTLPPLPHADSGGGGGGGGRGKRDDSSVINELCAYIQADLDAPVGAAEFQSHEEASTRSPLIFEANAAAGQLAGRSKPAGSNVVRVVDLAQLLDQVVLAADSSSGKKSGGSMILDLTQEKAQKKCVGVLFKAAMAKVSSAEKEEEEVEVVRRQHLLLPESGNPQINNTNNSNNNTNKSKEARRALAASLWKECKAVVETKAVSLKRTRFASHRLPIWASIWAWLRRDDNVFLSPLGSEAAAAAAPNGVLPNTSQLERATCTSCSCFFDSGAAVNQASQGAFKDDKVAHNDDNDETRALRAVGGDDRRADGLNSGEKKRKEPADSSSSSSKGVGRCMTTSTATLLLGETDRVFAAYAHLKCIGTPLSPLLSSSSSSSLSSSSSSSSSLSSSSSSSSPLSSSLSVLPSEEEEEEASKPCSKPMTRCSHHCQNDAAAVRRLLKDLLVGNTQDRRAIVPALTAALEQEGRCQEAGCCVLCCPSRFSCCCCCSSCFSWQQQHGQSKLQEQSMAVVEFLAAIRDTFDVMFTPPPPLSTSSLEMVSTVDDLENEDGDYLGSESKLPPTNNKQPKRKKPRGGHAAAARRSAGVSSYAAGKTEEDEEGVSASGVLAPFLLLDNQTIIPTPLTAAMKSSSSSSSNGLDKKYAEASASVNAAAATVVEKYDEAIKAREEEGNIFDPELKQSPWLLRTTLLPPTSKEHLLSAQHNYHKERELRFCLISVLASLRPAAFSTRGLMEMAFEKLVLVASSSSSAPVTPCTSSKAADGGGGIMEEGDKEDDEKEDEEGNRQPSMKPLSSGLFSISEQLVAIEGLGWWGGDREATCLLEWNGADNSCAMESSSSSSSSVSAGADDTTGDAAGNTSAANASRKKQLLHQTHQHHHQSQSSSSFGARALEVLLTLLSTHSCAVRRQAAGLAVLRLATEAAVAAVAATAVAATRAGEEEEENEEGKAPKIETPPSSVKGSSCLPAAAEAGVDTAAAAAAAAAASSPFNRSDFGTVQLQQLKSHGASEVDFYTSAYISEALARLEKHC